VYSSSSSGGLPGLSRGQAVAGTIYRDWLRLAGRQWLQQLKMLEPDDV